MRTPRDLASTDDQELLRNEAFAIGEQFGLHFRLRRRLGNAPESARWYLIEQNAFAVVGPVGITQMDLVCSGHTPEVTVAPVGTVREYDEGTLGCGDGLPQQAMRWIRAAAIGDVVKIVIRDPSAREDLPALARMNGHEVLGAEPRDDGATVIVVERRK